MQKPFGKDQHHELLHLCVQFDLTLAPREGDSEQAKTRLSIHHFLTLPDGKSRPVQSTMLWMEKASLGDFLWASLSFRFQRSMIISLDREVAARPLRRKSWTTMDVRISDLFGF